MMKEGGSERYEGIPSRAEYNNKDLDFQPRDDRATPMDERRSMLDGSTKLTMHRDMRHDSVQDDLGGISAVRGGPMHFPSTGRSGAEKMRNGGGVSQLDDAVLAEAGGMSLNQRNVKSSMNRTMGHDNLNTLDPHSRGGTQQLPRIRHGNYT